MNEAQLQSPEAAQLPLEGGKYVYCIVRSDRQREFGGIGIGGNQRVYTVHHNDLVAVVSDTPIVIYDPTRENVLAHEFVNETVMKEHTVIPMSFGTVFPSEDDVTEFAALDVSGVQRSARQDAGQDRVRSQGPVGSRQAKSSSA